MAHSRTLASRRIHRKIRLPVSLRLRSVSQLRSSERVGDLQRAIYRHHGYCSGNEQQRRWRKSGYRTVDLDYG